MPTATGLNPHKQLGGLYVESSSGEKLVFPLKHTEVLAKIAGNLSRVEVTQSFENPFTKPLEAIYVFPLPDVAAVDDMEIKIGDRVIKGNIKKREEAQQIYQQAKREGRTAGLLEQQRDNIFTQSLANIKPGEQIDVTIRYTDSLKFEGGNYEFVFPMVVGPRYIPGTQIDASGDTDQVADASRITPPVMPPEMRSGHDIGVTIEIDAGLTIANLRSTSHQLRIEEEGQITRVKLGGEDTIPNKDLIVRYQVSGDKTQSTVLHESDHRGGHFAIYLIPALEYKIDEIVPKSVIFLMDTSGSQWGDPLLKCQELVRRFINGLNPHDAFTIIDFANTATYLSSKVLPNTHQNRTLAINYVNQLQADGGTELMNGINAVMKFPPAPDGRLQSIVLLTDGYIGNDNEILAAVQQQLKPGNRLYSFGVGSSVNRYLLNRIAEIGRGTCQFVRQDESTEEVAEKFFRQINNPVLTNIEITWEGEGEYPLIYPEISPDLFAEQPLVLFGRKSDRIPGNLHIRGIAAGGKQYQKTFNLIFEEKGNPAVAQLWGRSRIKDIMNQMLAVETKSGVDAVTETALTYQLLSQYTAFVAVSDDVRVNPDSDMISMEVPVEMPEGVNLRGSIGSMRCCDNFLSAPTASASLTMAIFYYEPECEDASTDYEDLPMMRCYSPQIAPAKSIFAKAKDAVGRIFGQNQTVDDSDSEEFGLQSDSMAAEEEEKVGTSASVVSNHQLEVISVTGLDQAGIAAITQYLQNLKLPSGFCGEIVFEFTVNKGRVGRIMLDEEVSTLTENAVVEVIKRSLVTWKPAPSATGTVRLTLHIQS
ncbi:MAG TPA: trypsin [Microcoleaceae bacterium UBA11344]|nr:trypsin [Microcoleaceae cyanobacterium UBA11344]